MHLAERKRFVQEQLDQRHQIQQFLGISSSSNPHTAHIAGFDSIFLIRFDKKLGVDKKISVATQRDGLINEAVASLVANSGDTVEDLQDVIAFTAKRILRMNSNTFEIVKKLGKFSLFCRCSYHFCRC
jgi:hypothetical protein